MTQPVATATASDRSGDAPGADHPAPKASPQVARWQDFLALLKPRVMSLVVFTALTGLICAGKPIHPVLAAVAVLCIAVGAGASGALNMWYEIGRAHV